MPSPPPNRLTRSIDRPRRGFRLTLGILAAVVAVQLAWSRGSVPFARGDPARAMSGMPRNRVGNGRDGTLQRLVRLGLPLRCGGGTERLVALTFDDGPGPYTRATLDILDAAGARATFFLAAKQIQAWPGLEDVPIRERALGAVGNHTWDHIYLPGADQATLDAQISRAQEAIARASGGAVRLFRPPFGAHDSVVDEYVRSRGMLQVLWSVDSMDSRGSTGPEVLANVLEGLHPGAIVLLHENRGTTLNVLPRMLRAIERRGYRAVSVPELLTADPPTMEQLRSGGCGSWVGM
jgi:peptidoglycan-N-acetylglucosamine deacetylase